MWDPITPKEKMMMKGRVPFDPSQGLMLEAPDTRIAKMDQLFRMGLANKGERVLMLRALKRDEDALKDPLLRKKLYTLLDKFMLVKAEAYLSPGLLSKYFILVLNILATSIIE